MPGLKTRPTLRVCVTTQEPIVLSTVACYCAQHNSCGTDISPTRLDLTAAARRAGTVRTADRARGGLIWLRDRHASRKPGPARSRREHGVSAAPPAESRSPSRHVLGRLAGRTAAAVLPPHGAGSTPADGSREGMGRHGAGRGSMCAHPKQRSRLVIREHPVVARYMATFGAAIKALDTGERAAIEQEIRSHIAEATAAGRPLDDVLEALGPAEALARAYAVELLMNPQNRRIQSVAGFLKLAVTVVVASFATLIVAAILGSIGITFTASGLAAIMVGMLETSGIH